MDTRQLWLAWADGRISDEAAQGIAEREHARRRAPPQPRRHVGSRPISSASVERRRRTSAAGWLPSGLSSRFTFGEVAVLSVIAQQVARQGRCELPIGKIAALAGVCVTLVKTAVREARRLGLISVEHRRVRYDRSLPNIISISSPEWTAWLRMRTRKTENFVPGRSFEGGGRFPPATQYKSLSSPEKPRQPVGNREFGEQNRKFRAFRNLRNG
jgi:hypothetical protein